MNRNRLLLLAAAAAVAVVAVIVVIVVASGGGSGGDTTTAASVDTTPGEATVSALFKGVPQSGDTLGKPGAPTLLVFEDPQCPFCRDFNVGVLPTVVSDFVRTGRVKLVWRGIRIVGPNSEQGLAAIYAAGEQNKLWQMAEAMYRRQGAENSGWITDAVIRESAADAGADPAKILAAMSTSKASMQRAANEANQIGLQGTPSFYVQRPPGLPKQVNITSLDPAAFSSALAAALQ